MVLVHSRLSAEPAGAIVAAPARNMVAGRRVTSIHDRSGRREAAAKAARFSRLTRGTGIMRTSRLPIYAPAEHPPRIEDAFLTRREILERTGMGMGAMSLAMLLGEGVLGLGSTAAAAQVGARRTPLAPKQPHFKTKAK